MVYCVFLDPSCIDEAEQAGEFGHAALFEILLGLLQNCFLAETKSWTVALGLAKAVEGIQDQDARKRALEILALFQTRSRFLDVIECADNDYETPCGSLAVDDWKNPRLDHLILGRDVFQSLPKTSTLSTYPSSGFSLQRSESVVGKTVRRGQHDFTQIFSLYFACIVRESSVIRLIDPIAGRFGENHFHNILLWIEEVDRLRSDISIELHTEFEDSNNFSRLSSFISEKCEGSGICFTVIPYNKDQLPHERFLVANHFTLVIGRGIDLVDPKTLRNRDLFVSHAVPPVLPASTFAQ